MYIIENLFIIFVNWLNIKKKILVIYVYIILISIYYWDLKGYGFLFLK